MPDPGMTDTAGRISIDEECRRFRNYLHNFQLDLPLALNFVGSLLSRPARSYTDEAKELLEQAIKGAVQQASFDPDVLRIGVNSGIAPAAEPIIKILEATHVEAGLFNETRQGLMDGQIDEARTICRHVLSRHPMAVRFADLLLTADLLDGSRPDESLAAFKCPKFLQPLWDLRLFNHHASLGDDEPAHPLWERVRDRADDPFSLSRAAEMHRRRGETDQAVALYERALALAPHQHPYRLRMGELASPFSPDHGLTARRKVAILLYSFNKAQVLGETLESLAGCDIGPARITVLLNGCTDDSGAVVRKARDLFPDNEFEIIELPVNVGAPAARNWLLSLPSTREAEYAAFLDDDVYLQPDWLAHLLTVAESDPAIGNVGCKVVFPGEFSMLQYLHRFVLAAEPDDIRVCLPTPFLQYDTGLYDVVRETRVVMGCLHLLRTASLADAPWFDIRYSPSQIDDTDHDIQLCMAGWKVFFCGTVTCVHRQNSGTSVRADLDMAAKGSIRGNDMKFFYKWYDRMDELRALDALSLA